MTSIPNPDESTFGIADVLLSGITHLVGIGEVVESARAGEVTFD
jgi:hypothetical protein